jgi:hypothetical protein
MLAGTPFCLHVLSLVTKACYISKFSITVTKYLRKSTLMKNDLFWLRISEFLAHGQLTLWFWACGEQTVMEGECMVEHRCSLHGCQEAERERERGRG